MNETIFFFFYNLAHQSVFSDQIIVFLAVYSPFIVVMLAGLFLLFHHEVLKAEEPFKVLMEKKKEIFLVFFSGALAWVLAVILKNLIHLPRPFLALSDVHPLFLRPLFLFLPNTRYFFLL